MEKEYLRIDDKVSRHYLRRYITLIDKLKHLQCDEMEKHHIYPRSIFGANDDVVLVPTRWHYLLHWILYKIFDRWEYRQKMIFAFNMMSRTLKKKKGVLYEKKRMFLSEVISKNNSGRKMSVENKKKMSERTLGTAIFRDKDGNRFRTSIVDPRVMSGELVHTSTGRKHSPETLKKMSENSGIKGRVMCYNEDTGKVKYFFENEIPEGYVKGCAKDNIKLRKSGYMNGKKRWYNNGEINKRYGEDDIVPEGFVLGRLKINGFTGYSNINDRGLAGHNKGKEVYINIIDGSIRYFDRLEAIPDGYRKQKGS